MKRALKQQVICLLVWVICFPIHALSQQPKENKVIRVEELFGKWQSEDDGSVIEIGAEAIGDNRSLALKGKHVDWVGAYQGRTQKLSLSRRVRADEMDDKAPLWARQEVEKRGLWWSLDLTPEEDCSWLKLTGKWYRGELSWREEKDSKTGQVKREAKSKGEYLNPLDVKYRKIGAGDEEDTGYWISEPTILVRSQVRPVSEAVPDSLYAKEPFFVEVHLPKGLAAKKGGKLLVTLKSRQGGGSSTLELRENGGIGFTRFENPFAVTLAGGSEAYYDPDTSGGRRMLPLSIAKEDVVEISSEGFATENVTTSVRVFQTQIAQTVDRARASLDDLSAVNLSLARSARLSTEDKAVTDRKLRLIANARRVMQLKDNPYIQLAVAHEHLACLLDPARWKTPWTPIKVKIVDGKVIVDSNGNAIPELMDDPNLPGVSYGSQVEKDMVYRGIENGKLQALESLTKSMSQISADLILFGISTTGADQFVILAFGISPTGERVDLTDRILAGMSLGSQALLGGSLAARQYRQLAQESQNAAKLFETEAMALERRPILGGAGGGLRASAGSAMVAARRSAVIGAEVDLEKNKLPVHEEITLPDAKVERKGGYHLQEFDDTCGVTVYEQMRRDVGLSARTEAENMIRTYKRGKAYRAGEGMTTPGLADSLAAEGFEVRTPTGISLVDIEVQIIKGRKVATLINVMPAGKTPHYHWVEVKEIVHEANGKHFVVYGDPWNGNVWKVDSCVFWQRMERNEVVFARWNQAVKTP